MCDSNIPMSLNLIYSNVSQEIEEIGFYKNILNVFVKINEYESLINLIIIALCTIICFQLYRVNLDFEREIFDYKHKISYLEKENIYLIQEIVNKLFKQQFDKKTQNSLPISPSQNHLKNCPCLACNDFIKSIETQLKKVSFTKQCRINHEADKENRESSDSEVEIAKDRFSLQG